MQELVTRLKSAVMRLFGSQESKGHDWSKETPSDVLLAKGLLKLLAEREKNDRHAN